MADSENVSPMEKKIIRQIEYYFGDFNLPRDKFLLEETKTDEGWVSMETMLKFKRLLDISSDKDVIVKFHWKNNHDEQDWIDLTKKFQNVTFAEMDISENDVPGFQYPMSKFKVFKKTRLQEFETNSIQELKAFLQESNEQLLHVDL